MPLDRPLKRPHLIFRIPQTPLIFPIPAPPRTLLLFLFIFNHSLKDQGNSTQEVLPPSLRRENLRSLSSCAPAQFQTSTLVPLMV